ncbi:HU family DNA-binding protein [Nonomuraea sp. SYSU D8015]|uniref:HU family DNA-binding protein n=1 Tax=Nonomuraea sp. SYSU D8015 TaxID=2593644 RepID=UPI001CB6E30D|nr:HU family DNA-binding protein [Nonomuraea sp. SYSU D8015]
MNKQELMDAVADHVGAETPKDRRHVSEVVNAVLAVIKQEVAEGGKVSVAGWGKFESTLRKARTARNPATQAEVKVPATCG